MRVGTRADRINEVWSFGDFTGPNRPQARVTIQRCTQQTFSFPTRNYRSIVQGQRDTPRELPNVKEIVINRAVDQDAATATITFFNTKPLPLGQLPEYGGDIDAEGYYTFNRGLAPVNERWGYASNEWRNWLREDRILRTYQGYGMDSRVPAVRDPNLIQTGTWLIDDVDIDSEGDIICTCRDLAAFLIEQFAYPNVVPKDQYPIHFEMRHNETTFLPSVLLPATAAGSSNTVYGTDPYGHTPAMAFDTSLSTYWLSVGNARPDADYSFEWLEANTRGAAVREIRFTPWKGNYTVYVSVKVGGVWQGSRTIPYNPNSPAAAPNGSNIKYVTTLKCPFEQAVTVPIATYSAGVDAIRLTFTNLADSDLGTYQYRAGVRNFDVFSGPQPEVKVIGNISDYTDIVKQLAAMGGFYWPAAGAVQPDPALMAAGRVYGDLETAGTGPVVDIPESVWDKKSLMDGITYVKEILGYIFFVDETGGVVFRSPNLWRVGNFTLDASPDYDRRRARVTEIPTIDENRHLIRYKVRLSNRNKRSRIVVGTADGRISAEVPGDETIPATEYPLKMERPWMWIDQNFCKADEALLMADLVKIRQNFTYRQGRATIKANPNLQPDDQVRIVERRTSEGYLHYISGYTSTWNAREGSYNMDLTTFWLGQPASEATGAWVVDLTTLSPGTQEYLRRMARI